jgi:hypothetical protein
VGKSHYKNVRQQRNVNQVLDVELQSAWDEFKIAASDDLKGCYSTLEIREKAGIGERRIYGVMKEWVARGVFEFAGRRPEIGIDGRTLRIPVYRFNGLRGKNTMNETKTRTRAKRRRI